jgi:hypothetical protein
MAANRYRTIRATEIVKTLLVAGLPYEVASGRRAEATHVVLAALEEWIESGLKYRQTPGGERLFDPVEVFNFMKWEGLNGRDNFWSRHCIPTARKLALEFTGSKGPLSKPLLERRFSVRLRRRFSFGPSLLRRNVRMRLPLPLASHAQDIEVKPIFPEGMGINLAQSNGRLEFKADMKVPGSLLIGADLSFTTNGFPQATPDTLYPEERELFLRPVEGLIRITPRISTLAETFTGADSSLEVAFGAWDFLLDKLNCGMVHYDQVDPTAPGDWVLDNSWFDCQLGSSLFIALCRARGIPSRLVSGDMLYDVAPGPHYWAEIWQDGMGWLPFDLLSWDLSAGGNDSSWRTHFAGSMDYRMVTQCFPLDFTGSMTVRFPAAWHLLTAPIEGGMAIRFADLAGEEIYTDEIVTS